MKTALTIAALVATALADIQPFTVMALRSASPIYFAQVNAAEQKFWLAGQKTESYCPEGTQCPPGTTTVFAINSAAGTLSLDVEVPGGQQVYIASDGAMSFTQAHSANIPEGSTQTGWTFTEGASFGTLSWEGGLVACPVEGKGYQIFGLLPNVNYDNCLGFTAATTSHPEAGAWQYS